MLFSKDRREKFAASLILLFLFAFSSESYPERGEFKVKEIGEKLEVTSPWGTKIYTASTKLNVMKNYKIEIPIDDLKPAGAEADYRDWIDDDEFLDEDLTPSRAIASEGGSVTVNNIMPVPSTAPGAAGPATPTPSVTPTPTPVPEKKEAEKEPEPDDTARLIVEANRFYNQGKYYEAQVYIEEVLRRKPKYVRAWVMKGSLLYVQGHKDLAQEAWKSVLEFDPENKQVKDLLSRYR